jgi:glycerol uptake facilitator-like aquaporin
MFDLPVWQLSTTARSDTGQWFAEFIATFGSLLTIFACASTARASTAYAVGLYITAAYWFTASTTFANPAVTIARTLSDTFAGIRPQDVAPFLLAQFAGAVVGAYLYGWLYAGQRAPARLRRLPEAL